MEDITYPHVEPEAGHCLWCGAASGFFKNGKSKKWCSEYCGTSASSFRKTGRVAPPPEERVPERSHCKGCGERLIIGGRNRNPKKWCSQSCRHRFYRENNPEYVVRKSRRTKELAIEREALKPPKPRCEHCGGEMASRRQGQRFCNMTTCQRAGYETKKASARRCAEPDCDRPVVARSLCGSHYSLAWRKKFPDKAHALGSRYRARKREAFVEDVCRGEVLERDSWRCGICGDPIPKNVKYPSPESASIDHIVPLSRGGEHSLKNVQAAHLLCNAMKRDRGGGEQLSLIG